MNEGSCVVGVDIGGSKIAAAVVAGDGSADDIQIRRTPAGDGPDAVLEAVRRLVQDVSAGAPLRCIGVGSAGVIDSARGVVLSATAALPNWAGTRIGPLLSHVLRCPVAVDNDVNAFALGELTAGAAAGHQHVLFVTVGTGVGGAIALEGGVVRGVHHAAGEIGHLPALGAEGLACPCGATGHVEAIASGAAIERRHAAKSGHDLDLRGIVVAANAGDPLAASALRDGATALGAAIAGLVNVLDPELVVLGGGVADIGPTYLDPMQQAYAEHLLPAVAGVSIVRARLGILAGVVGAAALAHERIRDGSCDD